MFEEMQRLAAAAPAAGEEAGEDAMSVNELSSKDMDEIRRLNNPPFVVRRTLEAVFLLLHAGRPTLRLAPPEWARVQRMLADADFISKMLKFEAEALQRHSALTAYVASEYFLPQEQQQQQTAGSEGRRGSVAGGLVRRRTYDGAAYRRLSSGLNEVEPLTFARVLRANRATAALFRWSALQLVQALELDYGPPLPLSPALAPVPAPTATAPAQQPLPPPPAPAPRQEPAPRHTPASTAASTLAPAPEPPKPQRVVPQNIEPDRNFELFSAFELGSSSLEDRGYEALQMVAATYCQRRLLRVRLISQPADIESEALARQRLVVAQQWLAQNGVAREIVTLSKETRSATDDPGVLCDIDYKSDKALLQYFWLVAAGEGPEEAGTKETRNMVKWLEENFRCCMH